MPTAEKARKVASPPYDVVSFEEARELSASNPLSFLRVLRAEIDLPPELDPYSQKVYDQARKTYQKLKEQKILAKDQKPALYVYSLLMQGHRQTGLATLCSVEDYKKDVIRKHEKTRPEKEDDRTRHILTLQAQTGLVLLTCPDNERLERLLHSVLEQEPLIDFTAEDGIQHSLWRVENKIEKELLETVDNIPILYIADGHHRAAAAARAADQTCQEQGLEDKNAPVNRFPAVIFPASQLQILPYNRVVRGLNGYNPESFLRELAKSFQVERTNDPQPREPGYIHLYLKGAWYRLALRKDVFDRTAATPVEKLDVSLLQDFILAPVLGIDNPRTDQRIDFIGGIRGTEELVRKVDSQETDLAFSLYPTTVGQLMEIAEANQVMPPKSTWFEPKLRDGLLVHELT